MKDIINIKNFSLIIFISYILLCCDTDKKLSNEDKTKILAEIFSDKTKPHLFFKKCIFINIQITKGASRQQKAALVRDVTDSLVTVLGKKPEHIHVVIQEIEDENWGYSGMLTDEWKKQQVVKP